MRNPLFAIYPRFCAAANRSTGWSVSSTGRPGRSLPLQAFLQHIVNGGGRIEREYGLGRMRTDLLIVWPLVGAPAQPQAGERRETQKVVIECKVLGQGDVEPPGESGAIPFVEHVEQASNPASELRWLDDLLAVRRSS